MPKTIDRKLTITPDADELLDEAVANGIPRRDLMTDCIKIAAWRESDITRAVVEQAIEDWAT